MGQGVWRIKSPRLTVTTRGRILQAIFATTLRLVETLEDAPASKLQCSKRLRSHATSEENHDTRWIRNGVALEQSSTAVLGLLQEDR